MRIYALWLMISTLSLYAWRNKVISLCGLIVLTTLLQRSDMPSKMMGIQGMNPWNILLFAITVAWFATRTQQGLRWDLPRPYAWILILYILVIVVAYLRAIVDLDTFPLRYQQTVLGFTSEELINRLKFMLPGLILFDCCRTRKELMYGLLAVMASVAVYALLAMKFVPFSTLISDSEFMRYRHRFDRDIGLNPIDLSMVLAGGFWGMAGLLVLFQKRPLRLIVTAMLCVTMVALGLTHSRGGYIGFAAVSLCMVAARWHRISFLIPVALVPIVLFTNVPDRIMTGFGQVSPAGQQTNWDDVTSGRTTDLWPPTLAAIRDAPLLGYGRRAFLRTDIPEQLADQGVAAPEHPHNAYLESLLDGGIIGLLPMLFLLGGLFGLSWRGFRCSHDPLAVAISGASLAATTSLIVTGLACQTFFPTQSTVGHWCLWGLAARMSLNRSRLQNSVWRARTSPWSSFGNRMLLSRSEIYPQSQANR